MRTILFKIFFIRGLAFLEVTRLISIVSKPIVIVVVVGVIDVVFVLIKVRSKKNLVKKSTSKKL